MTAMQDAVSPPTRRIHRVEIHAAPGQPDTHAGQFADDLQAAFGSAAAVTTSRVFLVDAALDDSALQKIADHLLSDPVSQRAVVGSSPVQEGSRIIEVHYKPGVMDPVAQSTMSAILEMQPDLEQAQVRTGFRFDLAGVEADDAALQQFAQSALANSVIQDIYLEPYQPNEFIAGSPYEFHLTHVPIRELDDDGLQKLSREGHLFLSPDEMRAVRDYYRSVDREPTDIELETLAQTWSEHCVHKTLKSTIRYEGDASPFDSEDRPGHSRNEDGSLQIENLLKSTIAAATKKLMQTDELGHWCVSVFEDNAGIVRFDDEDGVCIKVETHNHPSAIEPYGGAATGIGGCIRDIMGTGLAGRPIANTDVFCVAPSDTKELPAGVMAPKRILQQVVAGVRDYGNRMGIPTINGAVWFDPNYLGNPLVFAGCVGLIPLDKCFGDAQPGDRIIVLGGSTGRDGIHGATFSSAELTDTHADEFSHAVQIGNAITQKQTLDVIMQARDAEGGPLFRAITDCGAGGYSSAVGEMGEKVGARVTLETAPLKYDGLSYTEIWISEAQERMVLAVPPANVERLRRLCESEDVEMCDLGEYGVTDESGTPQLVLTYHGNEVGRLAMQLLHEGIPTPTREAKWNAPAKPAAKPREEKPCTSIGSTLTNLLSHPNIASKHWIIRQYDHEVQGGSAVKPLVGAHMDGPSDASVIRPKLNSQRGVAIGCGLQTGFGENALPNGGDSYWMTLAAIDEAVRNLVCVGADPSRIALLDNFCWPSCDKPENLGSLVRAAEACYDGAMAYKTPFVSGKDSLNNQFTTEDGTVIAIPPTMLITGLGIVPDVMKCHTMDGKQAGNLLLIVGETGSELGGSHYMLLHGDSSRDGQLPRACLKQGPATAAAVASLITKGLIASAHDCSEGGLLVSAAEMSFAGRIGLSLNLEGLPTKRAIDDITSCFAETPSRYLIEVEPNQLGAVTQLLRDAKVPHGEIGRFEDGTRLTVRSAANGMLMDESISNLQDAWLKPLDW